MKEAYENENQRKEHIVTLARWSFVGMLVGIVVGVIGSLFSITLERAAVFRGEHHWIFYCLPLLGLCIAALYEKYGQQDGGTNQVLSTIRSKDDVAFRAAPMIFLSTALTHLGGASAGREGAAIQLGGSIANQLGKWIRMKEEDRHIIVMCGMSAGFSALFGTPMAAAFFSMEVVSVGIMYYAALMPCVIAAIVAKGVASCMGVHGEIFHVMHVPEFGLESGIKMGIIAVGCALVSILFCMILKETGKLYNRWLKNPYLRIAVAGLLIIGITLCLQTDDYMGPGSNLILRAVEEGQADYLAFFWKMILTAITMKAGFKGGEIVPSFCIGATFGCVMGQFLGISPSFCAAVGMTAVFCGVTNCPVTSILIAFELFGYEGEVFYLIAAAVSYAASGRYSLYKAQRIVYSKYHAKYINQKTRS